MEGDYCNSLLEILSSLLVFQFPFTSDLPMSWLHVCLTHVRHIIYIFLGLMRSLQRMTEEFYLSLYKKSKICVLKKAKRACILKWREIR